MNSHRVCFAVGLLCVGMLLGCSSEIPRYTVTGAVTFDGEVVEKGEISFVPQEPGEAPEGGPIENGTFRVEVTEGQKIVQIRGSRPLPPEQQDSPEMGLLYEDYIPAKHHRDSTLSVTISPDGENNFTFDLPPKSM